MRGLILGTGPSLKQMAHLVPLFDGLIFGPNNTFEDFPLDVWLACDPAWHSHNGQVEFEGRFDAWHWNFDICSKYGYRFVEGVWHDGLWLEDKSKISLNHGSCPQLINLACHYDCDEIVLVGHDFHYDGDQRHYFDDLSDVAGEYPEPLRKWSKFIKNDGRVLPNKQNDDLLAVYKRIADTPGRPEIYNATPDSLLPWFPFRDLQEFLR